MNTDYKILRFLTIYHPIVFSTFVPSYSDFSYIVVIGFTDYLQLDMFLVHISIYRGKVCLQLVQGYLLCLYLIKNSTLLIVLLLFDMYF